MGFSHSKIPSNIPGQVLKLTGIEEFDQTYKDLETSIKDLDHIRTEVDLRFTDFIRSLGASKLWERCSDFKEMLRMMIVVLATNGKGTLNKMIFNEDKPPYLIFSSMNYTYKFRILIEDFRAYVMSVFELSQKLPAIQQELGRQDIPNTIVEIYNNVADRVIENNFSMQDMILCIKIVDENNQLIEKSIRTLGKLDELPQVVKGNIQEVFDESKTLPRLDRIMQQATQAMSEGLSTPEAIVKYFWPYPNS